MARPVITLTTDFGLQDHFVGVMKGVMLGIVPDAHIVDITHSVAAFDVMDGALTLAASYRYFPQGTVHVVVVDPGVGSARRPILVEAGGYSFVAPDNGVLSAVYEREPDVCVRHVRVEEFFLRPVSHTFHGRDIFSPVAAHRAAGEAAANFGPEISDYVRFKMTRPVRGENGVSGVVLRIDKFGNLITNIRHEDAAPLVDENSRFTLRVNHSKTTQLCSSFAGGGREAIFAIWGSSDCLEIVVNQGSAADITGAAPGTAVELAWD